MTSRRVPCASLRQGADLAAIGCHRRITRLRRFAARGCARAAHTRSSTRRAARAGDVLTLARIVGISRWSGVLCLDDRAHSNGWRRPARGCCPVWSAMSLPICSRSHPADFSALAARPGPVGRVRLGRNRRHNQDATLRPERLDRSRSRPFDSVGLLDLLDLVGVCAIRLVEFREVFVQPSRRYEQQPGGRPTDRSESVRQATRQEHE